MKKGSARVPQRRGGASRRRTRLGYPGSASRLGRWWPLVLEAVFIVILGHAAARGARENAARRYHRTFSQAFDGMGRAALYAVTPSRCDLGKSRILVVGDSMAVGWNWPADRLGLWGQATDVIRDEFETRVVTQRYARIILWPGTAHFVSGGSVEQYVADVGAMIHRARARADRVTLLSPIPGGRGEREAREAFARVRGEFPDLEAIDLSTWRRLAVDTKRWAAWSDDGLHLNDAGHRHLGLALASKGLEVHALGLDMFASAKPTLSY